MKYDLSHEDWRNWLRDTGLFFLPTAFAFLTALQGGQSLAFATGSAYSALLVSAISLISRYMSGQPAQPTTPLSYQATTSQPTVEPTTQPSSEPAQ